MESPGIFTVVTPESHPDRYTHTDIDGDHLLIAPTDLNGQPGIYFRTDPNGSAIPLAELPDLIAQLRIMADPTSAPTATATGKVRRNYRLTPEHLAGVASVYLQALSEGRPPTRAVADQYGSAHSTAAKWVQATRREGLVPPALNQGAPAPVVSEVTR